MSEKTSTAATTAMFDNIATKYERMTSGATRRVARQLLTISPQITSESVILDNACGTGIMTQEILASIAYDTATIKPSQSNHITPTIHATDISAPMITHLQSLIASSPVKYPNVTAHLMPAEHLDFTTSTFTHIYTNLGILFFADPLQAAREIHRTLRPGGTALTTCWTDLGYWDAWLATESRIRPRQPPYVWPVREDWLDPATIESVMRNAGFEDVTVRTMPSERREKDARVLAENLALSFDRAVQGWSPEEKRCLVQVLEEELKRDRRFFVDEETGEVVIRMVALVAVCCK